jgi:hypothetical protein
MRPSAILGSIGSVMLILSAPAHSLLGWPQLREQLARVNAPGDLVTGLEIGWHFAGVAMVALGLIALRVFTLRGRGVAASLFPAVLVATTYLLFGAWALVVSGFDLFFLVFVVPGALLLFAALMENRHQATGA